MLIQLKQREIIEALKMFISQQGISLAGKTVEIEFTSGRKDNGLSAELTIEDDPAQNQAIPSGPIARTVAPAVQESAEPTNSTDETASPKASLFK